MLFPHATTRPLKAMEAYRVAVMGLHRKSSAQLLMFVSVNTPSWNPALSQLSASGMKAAVQLHTHVRPQPPHVLVQCLGCAYDCVCGLIALCL